MWSRMWRFRLGEMWGSCCSESERRSEGEAEEGALADPVDRLYSDGKYLRDFSFAFEVVGHLPVSCCCCDSLLSPRC